MAAEVSSWFFWTFNLNRPLTFNKIMTFEELLKLVSGENAPRFCLDSRQSKAGDIFIAIRGNVFDGHNFIGPAIERGAKYVVCEKSCNVKNAEVITVAGSAIAAARLVQAAMGNPASRLTNLAVTGTNGKTTVAFLVRSIIQAAGQKCGLISTIFYDTCTEEKPAMLTTPDALTIAEMQKQMLDAGAKYMVTEASSHALAQNRLAEIDFKAAAFTNLTGDHLDYHKSQDNYLAAKTKLFEKLSVDATAVLNKDCPHAEIISKKTKAKILWYGLEKSADLQAKIQKLDLAGSVFELVYNGQKQKVTTSLAGKYNICNCLAAAGLALAAGFDLAQIATGIANLKTIPGRLERIESDGVSVIIDYAHTDDALKNVLSTLKPLCKGRLTAVFGCGGDRDTGKRPRMAAVAEKLADKVIITSDNPRSEQPAAIIGEIVTGLDNPAADTILVEPDREKAIERAIANAEPNDIVLIAGKGHEAHQIIGTGKIAFSDFKMAEKYLAKRK